MLITSLDNEKIKGYLKLKSRKYRKKTNTFIVEGMHLVLEAYKKGIIKEVVALSDTALPLNVPFVYVSNDIMRKLSDMESVSSVIAICKMPLNEEIKGEKILILDNLQDPGNLGTIIRSSVAFNIDTIVLSPDTVDLYNPKVIRSTQCMMFHTNIIVKDLLETIKILKEREIPVYGTRVDFGENVRNFKDKDRKKYALVMGNEGNGVNKDILSMCDGYLYIPTNENVESLNVGVATSILLYELDRR